MVQYRKPVQRSSNIIDRRGAPKRRFARQPTPTRGMVQRPSGQVGTWIPIRPVPPKVSIRDILNSISQDVAPARGVRRRNPAPPPGAKVMPGAGSKRKVYGR